MTWVTVAVIGGGATLLSGMMQSDAASSAAGAQSAAAQAGIDEQRRQFDAVRKLLEPYTNVGTDALTGVRALTGLGGAAAQQQAISGLENSPLFQAQVRQGEQAMLQRASATGGLRGGNMQAALAQFRPQMLSAQISDQLQRLGGLTSLGQQSAAGVGTAGMNLGTNVANLMGQAGAAQAGGILGGAAGMQQALMGVPSSMMMYSGMTGRPMFGGATGAGVISSGGGLSPVGGGVFGAPVGGGGSMYSLIP